MKKIFALVLVLATLFALSACGNRQAEVVDNVEPNANTVVVETPPAIVSGTETGTVEVYPAASSLPTTAPTIVPTTAPTTAPSAESNPVATPQPTAAPNNNTNSNNNNNTNTNTNNNNYTPTRNSQNYNATISKAEIDKGTVGYVSGEGVNFRVGPGSQYKIIECLKKGTQVTVLSKTDSGWTKIWYNDYVGYIYTKYITDKEPDSSAVVIPDETASPSASAEVVPSATVAPTETPAPSVVVVG